MLRLLARRAGVLRLRLVRRRGDSVPLLALGCRDGLIEKPTDVRPLGPAVVGVVGTAGVALHAVCWPVSLAPVVLPVRHVGDVNAWSARQVPQHPLECLERAD